MTLFKKATKSESKLRLALIGISGSGKTYSSLSIASGLGTKIAVIDTEHGSASKYADLFEFDVCELDSFSPKSYIDIIKAASKEYDVLIIDSLSHAWTGKEGALEMVNNAQKRSQSNNSYFAWRDVTPLHNELIDSMIQARCHIIATMRAKTEYVVEKDSNGKTAPRKIGMAPVQRDGMEYEFDVVGDLNSDNELIVTKSRIPFLHAKIIKQPDTSLGASIKNWLMASPAPAAPTTPTTPTAPTLQVVPPPVAPITNESVNREPLKKRIGEIMEERGITPTQAREIMQSEFGKQYKTRDSLDVSQMTTLIDILNKMGIEDPLANFG